MPNQVTLTFAGEEKQLTDSMDRVGGASKKMSDSVGSSAAAIGDHANGLGKLGEAADNSERNIIGVHDVIDGTATIMQGPGKQGIVAYIQGWADLAGGVAPLIMSLAETKAATIANATAQKAAAAGSKIWAAAQWLMNASLWGCPVLIIVAGIVALIAIIVLIATKTDWFQKAWTNSWKWIKGAAANTWEFLKKIPGWIGSAFSKVANFIMAPYKAAFNGIAHAWNNTVGRLSWSVPGWVPFIGGNTISVPRLPTFHSGVGTVPGVVGENVMAVLQAGETVSSIAGGGGAQLTINSGGSALDELLTEILSKAARRAGGSVQVVYGGRNSRA